jgi:hypothetical protein
MSLDPSGQRAGSGDSVAERPDRLVGTDETVNCTVEPLKRQF